MFHFGGFPSLYYLIHIMILDSSSRWFPNSEICGSRLIYSSPQLIAVSHVLRRLPMPRHSPYALLRLNFLLKWFSHFALSSQIIFSVVVFTVNFAFCAKICSFFTNFTEKPPTFLKESRQRTFVAFTFANTTLFCVTFTLLSKITCFSQLSVSFSFFIRFSMNILSI